MNTPAPLPAPSPQKFLRLPDVEALIGWRRSHIYAEVAAGRFPRQIKLGPRCVVWSEAEIAQWQAERLAERDAVKQ
jgi:prophage regulatory protein